MTKTINYAFRWAVKQTGPNSIEVLIPVGNGPSILNPEFAKQENLSDGELNKAEMAVLESIAIIR